MIGIIPAASRSTMEIVMRRLLVLLLIVSCGAISACKTNPATGRSQLILISADKVSAMGAAAKPELVEQYGGEVESETLRAFVTRVGRRVAAHVEPEYAHIKWEFIVLDSEILNAFALPGGHVFVSRGLLAKFDNEAQVAGVLGHEIGHVTARHVDERLSQVVAAEFAVGGVGRGTDSQLAVLAARMISQGTLLKFNRDQEQEADGLGVKYMTRAKYDPHGMLEVLEVLAEASEGSGKLEILSTHPDPKRRIKTVRGLLAGEYAYTQGDPKYKKQVRRFARDAAPHLGQ